MKYSCTFCRTKGHGPLFRLPRDWMRATGPDGTPLTLCPACFDSLVNERTKAKALRRLERKKRFVEWLTRRIDEHG